MQNRRSRSQSLKKIHVGGGGGGGGGGGAGSQSSNGSQGVKSAKTSALPTKLIKAQDRKLLDDHDYDNNCYLKGDSDNRDNRNRDKNRSRDPLDNKNNNNNSNNSKKKSDGNTGNRKEKQRNSKLREEGGGEGGGGEGSFTDCIDNNLFSAVQDSSLIKTPEERERGRGRERERRGEGKGDDECNFEGMKNDSNSNEEFESNPHQGTPALPPSHPQHTHWYFTKLSNMFDGSRVRKI